MLGPLTQLLVSSALLFDPALVVPDNTYRDAAGWSITKPEAWAFVDPIPMAVELTNGTFSTGTTPLRDRTCFARHLGGANRGIACVTDFDVGGGSVVDQVLARVAYLQHTDANFIVALLPQMRDLPGATSAAETRYLITGKIAGQVIRIFVVEVLWESGGKRYLLSLNCPDRGDSQWRSAFEGIITSLQIPPPANAK